MAKSDQNQTVGTVTRVEGTVTVASTDDKQIPLKAGQPVFLESQIKTGESGNILIKFIDGSKMALGPDRMGRVCDYYHPDAEKGGDALAGDPSIDLPPPAAGTPGTGNGSGQPGQGQGGTPGQSNGQCAPDDPTCQLPPPSAGNPGGGNGSSSIQEALRVLRIGRFGNVDAGYDTQGPTPAIAPLTFDTGAPLASGAAALTPIFTMGTDFSVDERAGTATFTIFRSGDLASAATVNYSTRDGTANTPSDYTSTSGTASFAPYQTSITVTVPIIDNAIYEGPETFSVVLSNPSVGSSIGDDGAQVATIFDDGTILDDDRSTLTMSPDFSVNEAAGTATFTVTRGGDTSQTVMVNYATGSASDTATAGSDYTAANGTLIFGPGQTSATIGIPILNDTVFEGAETLSLNLSSPSANARISDDGTQVATIWDDGTGGPPGTDDDRPTLSVNNITVTEGTDTHAVFTVSLSNPSVQNVVFTPALASGTATVGTDTGA
ncbi:MAG: hypothetical protein KJ558_13660, partial [Gammaproteobacteria bacterium]|nr:hypothetical protein [Gammaproteobacteria bacterium]MBU1655839.1 hypothetical protein [Gammaproteobacteria bacterium]MBU1961608.1 hypothetical protein [Gammaproteobacteria bacterium]